MTLPSFLESWKSSTVTWAKMNMMTAMKMRKIKRVTSRCAAGVVPSSQVRYLWGRICLRRRTPAKKRNCSIFARRVISHTAKQTHSSPTSRKCPRSQRVHLAQTATMTAKKMQKRKQLPSISWSWAKGWVRRARNRGDHQPNYRSKSKRLKILKHEKLFSLRGRLARESCLGSLALRRPWIKGRMTQLKIISPRAQMTMMLVTMLSRRLLLTILTISGQPQSKMMTMMRKRLLHKTMATIRRNRTSKIKRIITDLSNTYISE